MNEKGICQPAMATQMHKDRRKKEDVTSPKAGCRGQRSGHAAHAKNVVTTDEPHDGSHDTSRTHLKEKKKQSERKTRTSHKFTKKAASYVCCHKQKHIYPPKGLTYAYRRISKAYEYNRIRIHTTTNSTPQGQD